jgi:hypothetical protein
MEVIAEGVESRAQLEFLRRNACLYAQGRLFGEPCSVEELLALLATQAAGGAAPFAHLLRKADEAASRSAWRLVRPTPWPSARSATRTSTAKRPSSFSTPLSARSW